MASDPSCLRAALELQIRKTDGLNARHYPSVGLTLASTPYFGLVTNCFAPAPNGEKGVVSSGVHHHGHLLLSTVNAFGPGYEHWRFTTPKLLDQKRELFSIKLVDREIHRPSHVAFVDADMPHAVVMPPSLTITFALWSSKHPVTWREHVKRLRILRGREDMLRKVVERLGISQALAVNTFKYVDYYPVEGGFKGMKERIQFALGPNEDFLPSFFHILQQTKNDELASVVADVVSRAKVTNPDIVRSLVADLRSGRDIPYRFSPGIHRLDHMNFKTDAMECSLAPINVGDDSSAPAPLSAIAH